MKLIIAVVRRNMLETVGHAPHQPRTVFPGDGPIVVSEVCEAASIGSGEHGKSVV